MNELSGDLEHGFELDEYSVSELLHFLLLLDKWDGEASEASKSTVAAQGPSLGADCGRD